MEEEKKTDDSSLAMELKAKIMFRLPLEDVVRFRCVSKHWRDEIDSPYFKKSFSYQCAYKHLSNSIIIWGYSGRSFDLFSFDFCNPESVKQPINYRLPNFKMKDVRNVVGSCNGLLCFQQRTYYCDEFWLYNPVTYDVKHILHNVLRGYVLIDLIGFGYDCKSNDFKIVNLVHDGNGDNKIGFCIYSLNKDSWKIIKPSPSVHISCSTSKGMVFSNNSLNWLSYDPYVFQAIPGIISGFDLEIDEYFEVPQPDHDHDYPIWEDLHLADLRGCLHLVVIDNCVKYDMEIWIMKEYGVKESWTKLIHTSLKNMPQDIVRHTGVKMSDFILALPCAYSEDRREILIAVGNPAMAFICLDIHSQKFKKLKIDVLPNNGADCQYKVMPWVGSFFSPLMLE